MLRKILFSLFLLSPALMCQVTTGTVSRAIADPSGAALSDAGFSSAIFATGETREVEANERGEFNAPFLRVGEYSMTVSAPGFRTAAIQPVSVRVDQTVNLPVTLAVGAVNESVEVTATTPLFDSTTSSLGQVIENKKIVDLPLNGRNAFALGLLAGNTVPVSRDGNQPPLCRRWGRYSTNDVMLDGIDNNTSVNQNAIGRNGINYTPSVDAVAEFKVKTNNYQPSSAVPPERSSPQLKSGGNQFHGSAWDFFRNEKLDANNFFSNAGGVPASRSNRINSALPPADPSDPPRVQRTNQTFFFTDYEGLRRRPRPARTFSTSLRSTTGRATFPISGHDLRCPIATNGPEQPVIADSASRQSSFRRRCFFPAPWQLGFAARAQLRSARRGRP